MGDCLDSTALYIHIQRNKTIIQYIRLWVGRVAIFKAISGFSGGEIERVSVVRFTIRP